MGAFLEKPKTEKDTVSGEGHGLRYGVSAMQGWRMEMEDAHTCRSDVLDKCSFFGVFDGHAGTRVSKYCADHLLECILDSLGDESDENSRLCHGIRKGFLALDQKMRSDPVWASGEDRSGTTAIVVMITPEKVIFGNCGDSRALLCRNSKPHFATIDHKPYNSEEKQRIEKAGGTVMMQRVNGSLAVSRALGDFDYKRADHLPAVEQLVSPAPDTSLLDRTPEDQFILLACDGIFDVMSNEEVISYVLHQLELTEDLAKICSNLIDCCLNKNSRDNMSVILITFPSAPKVSQEAIEKEEKLQKECFELIDKELNDCMKAANDPLDLEENYVIQKLTTEIPEKYDVISKRKYISEKLDKLRKEKFGNLQEDFSQNQDDSAEFQLHGFQDPEGKADFGDHLNPEEMDEGKPPSPSSSPVENSLL